MYLKFIAIFLLLSNLNITLADQECKIKLYTEADYRGNYVREIFDSKHIKDEEVRSLIIIGDCTWDLYR